MVGRLAFAVPGDLATPTGGYGYDRRMIAELRDLGWQIDLLDLGDGFPWPSDATRAAALARLFAVPAGRTIVIDGLAFGVLPEAALQLARPQSADRAGASSACAGMGLSPAQADALRASERAALAAVNGVVVTSAATARLVASDYGVPAERITVASPGSDPAPLAQGSRDGIVRLLSVGAVVPRKGFDVLIAALATLGDLPWRLTIAGDRTRDRDTAAQLDADIARLALGERIAMLGAVSPERLAKLYAEADVFVLASRFEGYGMAYAEAIAHGLPVVGTNAGAIPDTVPADAGLLVAAGDIPALAEALRRVIGNAGLRQRLAGAARAAAPRSRPGGSPQKFLRARSRPGMSGFSADWLALREPYDCARAIRRFSTRSRSLKPLSSVRIVDLACGTGSTLRALRPHLPARQNWRLVDNDLGLLARATATPLGTCHRYGRPARPQPRSRSCARRAGRSGHHLGPARSRLRNLAGSAGGRDRRALDPDLCGVEL